MSIVTATPRRLRGQGTRRVLSGARNGMAPASASEPKVNSSIEASSARASSSGAHLPERLIDGSRDLAARVVCGLALLGLLAYASHSLAGLGGRGLDGFFENWVFNGLLLAGAALCLWRAASSSLERAAWSALGIGLGCWALGEVTFTLDPSQVTQAGFPGMSD